MFVLRLPRDGPVPRTIDAKHALARRNVTMLRAKRAIEALPEDGRVSTDVPVVEGPAALASDRAATGITDAPVAAPGGIDLRGLRERLQVSHEPFALRYGLEVETLRSWKTSRRELDTAARHYLRAIANIPERIEQAYAPTPSINL